MQATGEPFKRFTLKNILLIAAVTVLYLFISYFLIGFKSDQLVLCFLFALLYFLSNISRKFILGFSIFIVYWIVFDYMKALPNYTVNAVHIADLYQHEKNLFGISLAGNSITPNEYFLIKQTQFLDILSGVFYLCWVPVPLMFAGFLLFKNKEQFLRFSLSFFWINLLGFVVYYIYPAAPPWYMQQFGTVFNPQTAGNTAGLARFDSITGMNIFHALYAKSSNVFAAMPSLHSAYPLLVFYYGVKNKLGWMNVVFAVIMVGIWFAAIYTSHHYVLDVIAGIICAILGILSFNFIAAKTHVNRWMHKYASIIQ